MDWKGKWRNQYGSIVSIVEDANHRISGTFKTALKDSGFYGQEIPVVGLHQGYCISFVGAGQTAAGDAAVSYTGLLREGKMETMWFVVADSAIKAPREGSPGKREKLNWWRSISTSADTFERI
jgi:avidin family protein